MKRIMGVIFLSFSTIIGLVLLYIGISWELSQIAYGGAENLLLDVVFIIFGGGLLVLGARWGVSHEKRILAVLFFIGSILFLLMSINMLIGFNNSFPSLSDLWLQNMAMSRAHTRYRDQRIVSIQGDSFVANLSILEAKYVD